MTEDYLHGFSKKEQKRLLHQAEFLKDYVYEGLNLPKRGVLLEVGCGVGAQSRIISKKWPNLKIDGVDLSEAQLAVAEKTLAPQIKNGRVKLFQSDAAKMEFVTRKYDGAFLCWFLEHVPDPLAVLKEVRRHLKVGSKIICTEVFNQTLFLEPYAPTVLKYWFHFNDLQWSMKGHPFVGVQLGHYLHEAKFKKIKIEPKHIHFDSRDKRRRALFSKYFLDILLSAQEKLVASGRITKEEVDLVKEEFLKVNSDDKGVFYYSFIRGTGAR